MNDSFKMAAYLLEDVKGGIEKASMRAFNRAAMQGRTAAVRTVTKEYTVLARDVRSTIRIVRATQANPVASLVSRGPRLKLHHFKHSPKTDTTGNKRKPVRVAVKKGGLKPLGQAFVYNGAIFSRLGSKRLPVELKFGPSVPSLLNNDAVVKAVQDVMETAAVVRLEHETQRLLDGHK